MNAHHMVLSASLHFSPLLQSSIPLEWFKQACKLLADFRLSPVFFTANGGEFTYDDCYYLADRGDIARFGETIRPRRLELIEALYCNEIQYLGLDSPHAGAEDRKYWRARITSSCSGSAYVGVDEQLFPDETALLLRALQMSDAFFDVGYAIAYKMPLADHPESYARGSRAASLADALHMIRHRREWEQRKKTPDELWSEELTGQRRHLTGLFRGAYPANILSEAHVRSAALTSRGIGKLTELDSSLWLWELTDEEIPEAERMLESRGVLVRQVAS